MSTRPALLPRVVLAVGSALVVVLVVEGLLRLVYPELPSLSPLAETSSTPAGSVVDDAADGGDRNACRQPPGGEILHESWEALVPGRAEGPPLVLWTAGDSVTMGAGVDRAETFSMALAERTAAATQRPVALLDMGIQGAGYCNTIQDLHLRLDSERPDLVVLQLFADDLEQRALYTVEGRVIALPWRERDPRLRWLVSRSYLANMVWAQVRARVGDAPDRGLTAMDQLRFQHSMRTLTQRLDQLGIGWVVTLVAPAGLPMCADPAFAEAVADCSWMSQDMDLIAVMLVQAGLPFVDLRSLWHGAPDVTLEEEQQELARRGRLPVHPSAHGHTLIAASLWPAVEQALPGR